MLEKKLENVKDGFGQGKKIKKGREKCRSTCKKRSVSN